jgi:hypothetical protein
VLDADAVASAIRVLMSMQTVWTGTASDLLVALEQAAGERAAKSKGWPGSAESLGRGLRRPATFLCKVGIEVERVRDPPPELSDATRGLQRPGRTAETILSTKV